MSIQLLKLAIEVTPNYRDQVKCSDVFKCISDNKLVFDSILFKGVKYLDVDLTNSPSRFLCRRHKEGFSIAHLSVADHEKISEAYSDVLMIDNETAPFYLRSLYCLISIE